MFRRMINTRIYPGIILLGCVLLVTSAGATSYAYITNAGAATVSIIDTSTDQIIDTVRVESLPIGVAISPDGTKVYLTHYVNNTVSVIDTGTTSVIATVKVGTFPYGIAVTPDGAKVYVAHSGSDSVSVIDTGTNTVVGRITVRLGPYGVTVNPDGTKVYVANSINDTVSVIDTATDTVIATVTMGHMAIPSCIAVSPEGTRIYVTNSGSNNVSVIDTATNSITTSVTVESSPVGIAIAPDGTKIYVANSGSDSVSVIDTATNTVTATVNAGDHPYGIAITPDGTKVYVANYYSNTISVIDTATNTVITTVNADYSPIAFGQFISPYPIPPEESIPLRADFTSSGTTGVAPFTVQFQDTSQGNPTGWNWDLDGNGFKDYSEKNCTYTYTEPGDYTVSLSVTRDGELDSIIRADYIHVLLETPIIQMYPEWNFISTPKALAEGHLTAGEVFTGVNTEGHSIFRYDAQNQSWNQMNSHDELQPLQGIWIYSASSTQVPLVFSSDQTNSWTSPLSPGWNTVGFTGMNPVSAKDALLSVQNEWTQLIGFNAESQFYETSIIKGGTGTHNDTNLVYPGKGYWLFMTSEGILS